MKVTSGETGITVNKNELGAPPIQGILVEDAVYLMKKMYEGGITFLDTARSYIDSEEKLGTAFEGIRDKVFVATKTAARTTGKFREDLKISLGDLRTGHVGLYQLRSPSFCPEPGGGTGLCEAVLEAKEQGKIHHIGTTDHRLSVAMETTSPDIYEALQFPFCYLVTGKDLKLVKQCKGAGMEFVVMKALSDGLINNSRVAYAYLAQFDNMLPIWGVQRERELGEFLSYTGNPPEMVDEIRALIDKDRKELPGESCRGCGCCISYPVGIEINNYVGMSPMIRRTPSTAWLTPDAQGKMGKIGQCLRCSQYRGKCSYNLGAPSLLEKSLKDYLEILSGEGY